MQEMAACQSISWMDRVEQQVKTDAVGLGTSLIAGNVTTEKPPLQAAFSKTSRPESATLPVPQSL